MAHLLGKRIAIVATDYFEESELLQPLARLREMGATVEVVAPHSGELQSLRHIDKADTVRVDKTLEEAEANDYDAVILPGGVVNADHLRVETLAQAFVETMMDDGKPVAAICHGPWLLVSASLVKGRTLTSYHTLRDDITNAGGNWVDVEVQIDGNLITSRKPKDLPAFIQAIEQLLTQ